MEENKKILNELVEKLLDLMGVVAEHSIVYEEENQAFLIQIDSEKEIGLLIGVRGETINAVQTFIGMALKLRTGEWHRVIVNVGDWREKQADKLTELALSAAARAKETGDDQPLYNLSAADRRLVHMALVDDKEIETESFGEGEDRYLIIKLSKNSK